MYSVIDPDGPYIDAEGRQCAYRRGYVVKFKDSDNADQSFFYPAYCLTRDDFEPSHLRLVATSRPEAQQHAPACV